MDLNGSLLNASNSSEDGEMTWNWQDWGKNLTTEEWIGKLLGIPSNWSNMTHEYYDPECYLTNYFSYRKLFYATIAIGASVALIKGLVHRWDIEMHVAMAVKKVFPKTEWGNKSIVEKHRTDQKQVLSKIQCLSIMDKFYKGNLTRSELLGAIKNLSLENDDLRKFKTIADLQKEFPRHQMMNLKTGAVNDWIRIEKIIRMIRKEFFDKFTSSNEFEKRENRRGFSEVFEDIETTFQRCIGDEFIDRPFSQIIIDHENDGYNNRTTTITIEEDATPLVSNNKKSRSGE